MSTALQVTLIFAAIIGVAVTLGVAYAVTRSAARSQTQEIYERENEALTKALGRQEQENLRLQQKTDALAQANAVLQQTVSGTIAVKELAKEIQREEAARREEHQVQMTLLKDVLAQLRSGRGEIGR